MTRFRKLLNRYLDNTATEEEVQEFWELFYTGEHNHEITEEVMPEIFLRSKGSDPDQHAGKDLYEKILSKHNIQPDEHNDVPVRRSRAWLAAAAVIVLAIVGGVWFIPTSLEKPQHAAMGRFTNKGETVLPDGTKVTLNDNSELSYVRPFGKTNREVMLIGEATFDVAHDASKPFLVHTGKVTTKVLGTEFNISAYPESEQITVTVLRGLVEVGDAQRVYGKIRPNEQIAVDMRSNEFVQQKANAEAAVQWKANFLVLDDVDLEQAAAIIGKKFNVKITLEKPELKKCRIIGSFLENESLEEVLMLIGRIINVTYTVEKGGDIVLRGKGC